MILAPQIIPTVKRVLKDILGGMPEKRSCPFKHRSCHPSCLWCPSMKASNGTFLRGQVGYWSNTDKDELPGKETGSFPRSQPLQRNKPFISSKALPKQGESPFPCFIKDLWLKHFDNIQRVWSGSMVVPDRLIKKSSWGGCSRLILPHGASSVGA